MKEILGGKGANLAEMTRLGLPVPPGFTISTGVCAEYNALGGRFPKALFPEVRSALGKAARCCFPCAPVPEPRCRA
jgi:pyruvate,orthophosphate dikinase